MSGGKKNPHVIWIGIDPNLFLAGLDTKVLFGCDNYLKFSLNPVQEEQDEEKVELKLEDDVKEEVSSGEDDFDDSIQILREAENDNCADDESEQKIQTGVNTDAIDESRSNPKQRRDHSKKNPNLFCATCKKHFVLKAPSSATWQRMIVGRGTKTIWAKKIINVTIVKMSMQARST